MTDQLAQIIAKLPLQTTTVSQLRTLLKQLDGQQLSSVFRYQANQSATGEASLRINLPTERPVDTSVRNPPATSTQAITKAQATNIQSTVAPTAPVISLPISDKRLIDFLRQWNQLLELPLTLRFSQNKVTLELPNTPFLSNQPASSQHTPIPPQSGSNPVNLTSAQQLLTDWAAQPKPVVQFKFTHQPMISNGTTQSTKSNLVDPATVKPSTNSKSQPALAGNTETSSKSFIEQAGSTLTKTLSHSEKPTTNHESQLKQSFIQNQKPLFTERVATGKSVPVNKIYVETLPKVSRQDTLSLLRQIESKSPDNKQPLADSIRSTVADLAKFVKPDQANNLKTISLVERWLSQIPNGEQTTPKNLKNMIDKSGLFFERHLSQLSQSLATKNLAQLSSGNNPPSISSALPNPIATASNTLAVDWKNILLILQQTLNSQLGQPASQSTARLDQGLQPESFTQGLSALLARFKSGKPNKFNRLAPSLHSSATIKQALSNLESGINRLQLIQAQNLPIESSQPPNWVFEIPFVSGEKITSLQLQLEQQTKHEEDAKQNTWRITIRFDLENLGVFNAITQLKQNQLDVQFTATNEATQKLLAAEMPALKTTLIDAGLMVGKTNAKQGDVPDLLAKKVTEKLVDVRI